MTELDLDEEHTYEPKRRVQSNLYDCRDQICIGGIAQVITLEGDDFASVVKDNSTVEHCCIAAVLRPVVAIYTVTNSYPQ